MATFGVQPPHPAHSTRKRPCALHHPSLLPHTLGMWVLMRRGAFLLAGITLGHIQWDHSSRLPHTTTSSSQAQGPIASSPTPVHGVDIPGSPMAHGSPSHCPQPQVSPRCHISTVSISQERGMEGKKKNTKKPKGKKKKPTERKRRRIAQKMNKYFNLRRNHSE